MLNLNQINDWVTLTDDEYFTGEWVDISVPRQWTSFWAKRLLGGDTDDEGKQRDREREGAETLRWIVQVSMETNFSGFGPFGTVAGTSGDMTKECNVGWYWWQNNYQYDEVVLRAQGSKRKILDILEPKMHACQTQIVINHELLLFSVPGASETNAFYGLPYWITPVGATSTFGWNGVAPTGYSSVGGLSATTYPNWANANGLYSDYTELGLFRLWREAVTKCGFEAADDFSQLDKGKPVWEFLTTYTVVSRAEELCVLRNEGAAKNDFSMKGFTPYFKGVPIRRVPMLDSDSGSAIAASDNRIYGVNWTTMELYWLKGMKRVKKGPLDVANKPNVKMRMIQGINNLLCLNRSANFVLSHS